MIYNIFDYQNKKYGNIFHMHRVAIAVLVIILVVTVWRFRPREHAYLSAPEFQDSLVDKYRSYIKDNRGMTLNDYALESHVVNSTPLSDEYKIL